MPSKIEKATRTAVEEWKNAQASARLEPNMASHTRVMKAKVKVLLDLSKKSNTENIMLKVDNVLDVFVWAIGPEQPRPNQLVEKLDVTLRHGLDGLANLALGKSDARLRLRLQPTWDKVTGMMLEALRSANQMLRKEALAVLRNLTGSETDSKIADHFVAEVVGVLTKILYEKDANVQIKENAVWALASCASNKQKLFLEGKDELNRIVTTFIHCCANPNSRLQDRALTGLKNLAHDDEIGEILLSMNGVVEIMCEFAGRQRIVKPVGRKRVANKSACESSEVALQGLHNLCGIGANKLRLVDSPTVINTLLRVVNDSPSEDLRALGFTCIRTIANDDEEAADRLFKQSGIITSLVKGSLSEGSSIARSEALEGLAAIAGFRTTARGLFEFEGVKEAMLQAARQASVNDLDAIAAAGMAGLCNFACVEETEALVLADDTIVRVILAGRNSGSEEVRENAVKGLKNLACALANLAERQSLAKIQISRDDVPTLFAHLLARLDPLGFPPLSSSNKAMTSTRANSTLSSSTMSIAGEEQLSISLSEPLTTFPDSEGDIYASRLTEYFDEFVEGFMGDLHGLGFQGIYELASMPEARLRMFEKDGVITSVFHALENTSTSANIRRDALMVLWRLSADPSVADALVTRWDMLTWLVTTLRDPNVHSTYVALIYLSLLCNTSTRNLVRQHSESRRLLVKLSQSFEKGHSVPSIIVATLALVRLEGGYGIRGINEMRENVVLVLETIATQDHVEPEDFHEVILVLSHLAKNDANRIMLWSNRWLEYLPVIIQKALDNQYLDSAKRVLLMLIEYAASDPGNRVPAMVENKQLVELLKGPALNQTSLRVAARTLQAILREAAPCSQGSDLTLAASEDSQNAEFRSRDPFNVARVNVESTENARLAFSGKSAHLDKGDSLIHCKSGGVQLSSDDHIRKRARIIESLGDFAEFADENETDNEGEQNQVLDGDEWS